MQSNHQASMKLVYHHVVTSAYFVQHSLDIKKTWEGIRKIVNVKKSVKFSISQLNVNGKILDDPAEITNQFNKYFVHMEKIVFLKNQFFLNFKSLKREFFIIETLSSAENK
jgi:hypothetical protein